MPVTHTQRRHEEEQENRNRARLNIEGEPELNNGSNQGESKGTLNFGKSIYFQNPLGLGLGLGLNNNPLQLQSGSSFSGSQKSGKSVYNVHIDIKYCSLLDSFICGYLKIKGLTDDWPQLCTFFEGEIIGEKYPFVTRKWDACEMIDRQHWSRFPSFQENKELLERFNDESYVHDHEKDDYIYMRWKEHFLVPDHKIKSISGASFAGFYYIVFQKSTGRIQGIYFHQNSEWFQQLTLEHIPMNYSPSWEFR